MCANSILSCAGVAVGLLASGLLCPSALAQKVQIEYDHDADFSKIQRYEWRTHPVFEKNPELKDVYSTGIQLVLEAGNQQLMKRGFQPDEAAPDIYVTFFILAKGATEVNTVVEPGLGGWGGYGWYGAPAWVSTEIEQYLRGMLVIDIIDAKTKKMIWRAYCGDKVKDMSKRDKNINSAVKKALDRFPPK